MPLGYNFFCFTKTYKGEQSHRMIDDNFLSRCGYIRNVAHIQDQSGGHTHIFEESVSNQLGVCVHHLKRTINFRMGIINQIKDLLLDVGARLEKLKICKLSQISTRIKQLLREEILAKKITSRYIHKVLPSKYKRAYRGQRELSSVDQGDYDIWTCTSSRKKFSVDDNVLKCQISLPLRVFKSKFKQCQLVFPSKSIWFKMDLDLDCKKLIYFGLGDGERSPPLYCLPLHVDNY